MIAVEKLGVILSPTDKLFENHGVLNPGIFQEGEQVHIFYRAVEDGNFSTIGYARSKGSFEIVERLDRPFISRDFTYEKHGVEDPRIVKIEGLYYMTYTAYDGINAMGALAVSKDLKHFEKKGIITPPINYKEYKYHIEHCNQEKLNPKYYHYYNLFAQIGLVEEKHRLLRDKDIVLFPRKINEKFVMLHRIWPGIQIVQFEKWENLTKEFWENYLKDLSSHIVLDPLYNFEVNYLGAGCPPIETEDGWLMIYHGVCETNIGKTYHAAAALLDINDPEKVIARLPYPLFSPEAEWELNGVVNHVVFPTGTALFDDDLYIYYGAADKHIAVAKLSLKQLLLELKKHP
ncbi:pesticidal protein Cry7Aa [Flavobacterium frigoris]|uniref:Glycoside hydrolase n=1 Tax=Flavobacterium frigoris (strain PS1) TaxID=1086011 RepID=H7FWH2_FLAFP|nr:pesticidal protein Cry7Aa [Flavobacterium frigoris]EIA07144.1 putative glycoside hydrolase [Flavobacterium frigoris PS1]